MQAQSSVNRECPVCYNDCASQGGAEVLHNPSGLDSDIHEICRECALSLFQSATSNHIRCPICSIDVSTKVLGQNLQNALQTVQGTSQSARPAVEQSVNPGRTASVSLFSKIAGSMPKIPTLRSFFPATGNPQPTSSAATQRVPDTTPALQAAINVNAHLDRIADLRRSGRTATEPAADAEMTKMLEDLINMTSGLSSQLKNLR